MAKQRGRKSKTPTHKKQPPGQGPRIAATPQGETQEKPTWALGFADLSGPWGWSKATKHQIQKVHERLKQLEDKTWLEVGDLPSCGSMPIEKLCREAQDRLAEIRRDDYDTLYKLRVDKAARVWGILQGGIFRLLWWDPEHTVYPMNEADN